ncbi:hypothetical protein [Roseomonas haemaphysalidis]|uniref:Molybdenum ABC transporter permease n=1 Tax=Roseomonas haemaphysalidis TaxID=2768162 RepID=A0ABS3KKS0_9PROT|nr:hypothetical protein [Roseomonas haemaphysalidis]MBO1077597.1 hypothetical protein [Roseomonas haemaphysalidis]
MNTSFLVAGGVLLAVGILLRHWRGRRAFHRRNASGLLEFNSYGQSVLWNAVDWISAVLQRLAMLGGVLLLVLAMFRVMTATR